MTAKDITVSSFTATWLPVSGATGYRLDVSTSLNFTSFLPGFQNLIVGNVTSRVVNGLDPGTVYFFRVRAVNANGAGASSSTVILTTHDTGTAHFPAQAATGSAAAAAASHDSADLGLLPGPGHVAFTLDVGTSVAWVSAVDWKTMLPPPTVQDLPPLLAYVMNLHAASSPLLLPQAGVETAADGSVWLTLQYRQIRRLAASGLELTVQASTDALTWVDLPASAITALADDDEATARFEARAPLPADGPLLLRLLVTFDSAATVDKIDREATPDSEP